MLALAGKNNVQIEQYLLQNTDSDFLNNYHEACTMANSEVRYALTIWLNREIEKAGLPPVADIVQGIRDHAILGTLVAVLQGKQKPTVRRSSNLFVKLQHIGQSLKAIEVRSLGNECGLMGNPPGGALRVRSRLWSTVDCTRRAFDPQAPGQSWPGTGPNRCGLAAWAQRRMGCVFLTAAF